MKSKRITQFLQSAIESELPINVYIRNGIKLWGTVQAFDDECLNLVRDGQHQIVLFSSVMTLSGRELSENNYSVGY